MADNGEIIVVLSTVPSIDTGKQIAHELISDRLAACVNIVPGLTSIYEWEGRVEEDSEALLIIKTSQDKFDQLADKISNMHPYDTPEIIALPVVRGNKAYTDWVKSCLSSEKITGEPKL